MIGGIAANNASGMCCGTSENSYKTIADIKVILADGTELDFTSAEIVRDDGDITEVSVVVKKDGLYTIYNALNEALAQGQEDGKHLADNNGGSDSPHSFAYTITFTNETSGRTEVYTLIGRFLSDETTKERGFLSEEDYNHITALLD